MTSLFEVSFFAPDVVKQTFGRCEYRHTEAAHRIYHATSYCCLQSSECGELAE